MSIGIIGHVNPNYLANLPGLSTVNLTVVPFVNIKCLWEITLRQCRYPVYTLDEYSQGVLIY